MSGWKGATSNDRSQFSKQSLFGIHYVYLCLHSELLQVPNKNQMMNIEGGRNLHISQIQDRKPCYSTYIVDLNFDSMRGAPVVAKNDFAV